MTEPTTRDAWLDRAKEIHEHEMATRSLVRTDDALAHTLDLVGYGGNLAHLIQQELYHAPGDRRAQVRQELADAYISVMLLADHLSIDIDGAAYQRVQLLSQGENGQAWESAATTRTSAP